MSLGGADLGWLDHDASQLSVGQKQRVTLARALVTVPDILLLDEPTHGFDPLQVMAFRDLLRTLSTDRVILFSSHIIQEVEALSDRVLLIHEGHLLADGTPDGLYQDTGQTNLENVFSHLVKTSQSHV